VRMEGEKKPVPNANSASAHHVGSPPINPRKLGSISSTLGKPASVTRLDSIRPSPDVTLGGVQKRKFEPRIPSQPHVPKERSTREEIDADFGPPSPPPLERRQHGKQEKHQHQRFPATSLSGNAASSSPFSSGPPSGGVKTKYSRGSAPHNTSVDGKKMEELDIDPLNPMHPTNVPFMDPRVKVKDEPALVPTELDDLPDISALNIEKRKPFMEEGELAFFQFPSSLPFNSSDKDQDPTANNPDINKMSNNNVLNKLSNSNINTGMVTEVNFANNMVGIPSGQIGKILIFKSGKMKLQLGEFLYDIRKGVETHFLEQVVTLDAEQKKCVDLGTFTKHFVVVPDLESLLKSKEM